MLVEYYIENTVWFLDFYNISLSSLPFKVKYSIVFIKNYFFIFKYHKVNKKCDRTHKNKFFWNFRLSFSLKCVYGFKVFLESY